MEKLHDELGRELPDDTPLELPVGAKRPESMAEMIQRMVRTQLSQHAVSQGMESIDEANDFDVEEEGPDIGMTEHERFAEMAEEFPPGYLQTASAQLQRAVAEIGKEVKGEAAPSSKKPEVESVDST